MLPSDFIILLLMEVSVKSGEAHINPDEIDDYRRISKAVLLVEGLARYAMKSVMHISTI